MTVSITNIIVSRNGCVWPNSGYEPRKMAISRVWRSEEWSRLLSWEKHHTSIITYWQKSYRSKHHCTKIM